MKDASIESGIFPKGFSTATDFAWPLVPAGSVVDLVYGDGLTEKARSPGPIPVYGTNGRCGWHSVPLTKGPGIILGRKGMGNLGVEWCETDFWVIDTAYYVRPLTADLDLKYFYYVVRYIGLNHLKDGTSNPSLTRDTFKRLLLPLPPWDTQRKIQQVLSEFDDKIEINRRMNETLEAMTRAVFQSWFVDFDPVHAKAAVRRQHPKWTNAQVSRAALPNVAPEIAELFPDSFEDSELGPIPAEWTTSPFSSTLHVTGGGTPKTTVTEYWGGDIPWFSVIDAPRDEDIYVIDTAKKITTAGLESSSTQLLQVGTTIISARGTVGRVAIVGVPMAMNQSCYALHRANGNGVFTYYSARALVAVLKQHSHGSVFDTITRDTLAGIHVVNPPDSVVSAFETAVAPLLTRIRTNLYSSRALCTSRDSLLPKLLSGELSTRV